MKTGTAVAIAAVAAIGLFMFSKSANASTGEGKLAAYNGGYIPDIPGVNPLEPIIRNKTPEMLAVDTNTYTLSSKVLGTEYGSYSASQIQSLFSGQSVKQAVATGIQTTKIEPIETTLASGSGSSKTTTTTQLITVAPSARDSSGQTAMDKIIAKNFAAQGKANPYSKKK